MRKREVFRKDRFGWKSKLLPIVLLLFLLGVLRLNLFVVKQLDIGIEGAECLTSEQAKNDLGLLEKNILFISEKEVTGEITQKYWCVKEVRLSRSFPGEVKVEIVGRRAIASLSLPPKTPNLDLDLSEATPSTTAALIDWSFPNSSNPPWFLVDETGLVFAQSSFLTTPIVFLEDEGIKVGNKFSSEVFSKLALIFIKLNELGLVSSGEKKVESKLARNNLLINRISSNPNWPRLAFSLEKDVSKQLASLQLILQKAKIDERVIETLDLRFDKPVIMYQKGNDGKR